MITHHHLRLERIIPHPCLHQQVSVLIVEEMVLGTLASVKERATHFLLGAITTRHPGAQHALTGWSTSKTLSTRNVNYVEGDAVRHYHARITPCSETHQ